MDEVSRVKDEAIQDLTRGGVSKAAWRSRMRLSDPLTLNIPGTSVAVGETKELSMKHWTAHETRTDRFP